MSIPASLSREKSRRNELSRVEFIALMAALMSLNALAIDIMLPALPDIGSALGVLNDNDRPLILSVYLLGVGFGQLLFGPLADRFGRRGPLLAGLAVYVITALGAVLAPGFGALLAFRLVQGFGAAAFRVISLAIVRDRFEGRAMAEIMSLTFMVFMSIPILAPGIGQLILLVAPWQAIFLFVGGFGAVVALWTWFRLPESLDPANRRPFTPKGIFGGFAIVMQNRFSLFYALAGMMVFGGLMGLINSAQQVYVGIYGLGVWFPLAFAGMAGLMAVASFVNARMVQRLGMRRIAHFALIIFTASGGTLFVLSRLGDVPFLVFYALVTLTLFMFGWVASNMNALSMEPLGHLAGTASSAFGFFQTLGGAFIGLLIGRYFDGSVTPVALGFTLVGATGLVFVLFAEKGKLFGTGEPVSSSP
jgi:MFS transporter, DHA1 family, multidrug resistance protein